MLRRDLIIAGALLVLGSMAVTATAQPPGGGGGLFGGGGLGRALGSGAMLLGIPEVQTELSLTDDQKEKIQTINDDVRQKARDSFQGFNFQDLQNMSDEERQKQFDDIRKKAEEAAKGVDEKITGVLDGKQKERLKQLQLQREGALALNRPEVIKKLSLTEEQQANIKKIQKDAEPTNARQFFDPNQSPEDRQAAFKKMRDQMDKAQKDCLAVLTDDQMLDWTNMCGKTFKFPERQGFGNRRRGGPPQ
jgi:Spy/CpxP family protein refolding chaperone